MHHLGGLVCSPPPKSDNTCAGTTKRNQSGQHVHVVVFSPFISIFLGARAPRGGHPRNHKKSQDPFSFWVRGCQMMGACLIRARPALDAAPPACVVCSYTGHKREGAPMFTPAGATARYQRGCGWAWADFHFTRSLFWLSDFFFLLLLESFMGVESFVLKTRIYWMGIRWRRIPRVGMLV
ncbi:hypothetical protein F5883DRAFT_16882 [Diaporthe sp. PMI_573]|nr:hypothetical protein F5883DRAFT_16882 [Diaporthaceae sp. PMI_573]